MSNIINRVNVRKVILIGLFIILAGFYAFTQYSTYIINVQANKEVEANWQPPTARAVSINHVAPQNMRTAMLNNYRLSPDRRFLEAVSEIDLITSGAGDLQSNVAINNNHWIVKYGEKKIGVLADFPEFEECQMILREFAQSRLSQLNIELNRPSSKYISSMLPVVALDYHGMIKLLEKIDAKWSNGERQASDIRMAATLYAALVFMHVDRMGLSDPLYAKSWAFLALAEEIDGVELVRLRCLMAYGFGYRGYAWRLSTSLSDGDPLKAFLRENNEELGRLANLSDADQETRYLWLRRLALSHDATAWKEWQNKYFNDLVYSLPVLVSALDLGEFQTQEYFAMTMTQMALVSLAQESANIPNLEKSVIYLKENPNIADEIITMGLQTMASAPQAELLLKMAKILMPYTTAALMDEFEAGLSYASRKHSGAIMSDNAYESFYRGFFYSGIFHLARFYVDQRSSEYSTQLLDFFIGSEGQTPVSRQVVHWYSALAQASFNRVDSAWIQSEFNQLNLLGNAASNRLFKEVEKNSSIVGSGLIETIRNFSIRLDSRYQNRYALLNLSYENLHDVPLSKRLAQNIIDRSPEVSEGVNSWYAFFSGDSKALKTLITSKHLKFSEHLRAINFAEKMDEISANFIESEYLKLTELWPNRWKAHKGYASFLSQQKRYGDAISVVLKWLPYSEGESFFDKVYATITMANMYEKLGEPEKGVAILAPVAIASYQGEALRTLSRLLMLIGDYKEALTVAKQAYDRYPNHLPTLMTLAKTHWNLGSYKEAAQLIANYRQNVNEIEWRFVVGKEFADSFKEKSDEETSRAFDALKVAGIDHFKLMNLIIPLHNHGRNMLSFHLIKDLRWNDLGILVMQIRGYKFLKSETDKAKALEWLKSRINAGFYNQSSMIIYREKQYELLWELITDPESGSNADFVWLMRAAAYASGASLSAQELDALKAYYDGVGMFSSYYDKVGNYLLGNFDEVSLLELVSNQNQRCEIAYYIGLKATHDHNLEYASDWFRVSMETGQEKMGEYRWSADELYRWYSKGKELSLN